MITSLRRALVVLSLLGGAPALADDSVIKGDAKRGKQIFVDDGCYQCHGRYGQGGRGSVLIPFRLPYAAYRIMVRQPTGSMPAYSERVFSEQSMADTFAYLQSLPEPMTEDKLPAILKP